MKNRIIDVPGKSETQFAAERLNRPSRHDLGGVPVSGDRGLAVRTDVSAPPATVPGKAEADRLVQLYRDAQNGLRRVVALGMYCFEIKSRLKHGQFEKWCQANVPDVSRSVLKSFMQLTRGVLERCGVQMSEASDICHGGQILLDDSLELSPTARDFKQKLCSIIDGRTANQLFLEFKNAKENDDGTLSPCTGAGKHHPRGKKMTPTEAVEAETRDAHQLAHDWSVLTALFLHGTALAIMDKKVLRKMLDDGIALNNKLRGMLK